MKIEYNIGEIKTLNITSSGPLETTEVEAGQTLVLPILEVPGSEFLGWVDDQGSLIKPGELYSMHSDVQLRPSLHTHEVTMQPGVGLIALFKSQNYTVWSALSEMVDNSLQSYLEHKRALRAIEGPDFRLRVDVEFIKTPEPVIIVRDNAAGIYAKDVPRAFTPAVPRTDQSGIGRYGIGMKSSATWFSDDYSIISKALGETVTRAVHFNISKIIEENSLRIPVVETISEANNHGTEIILKSLHRGIPTGTTLGRVRSFIASIYRNYLRNGEIEIVIGGDSLEYVDKPILSAPYWPKDDGPELIRDDSGRVSVGPSRYWKHHFEFSLSNSWETNLAPDRPDHPPQISGWIGILQEGTTKEAGFALIWRGKIVKGSGGGASQEEDVYKPRFIFGQSNDFAHQRLVGEFDVSDLNVTSSKDNILWGPDQEDDFLHQVKEVLESEKILRMTRNYRSTQTSSKIEQKVEKAVKSTAQVSGLALAESLTSEGHLGQIELDEVQFKRSSTEGQVEARYLAYRDSSESHSYSIEVTVDPTNSDLLSLFELDNGERVISVNRRHRYMESFANLPGADLDPILRLLVAVALTQMKMKSNEHEGWHTVLPYLNGFLTSWLSNRLPTLDVETDF